jgi:hypothetical protein
MRAKAAAGFLIFFSLFNDELEKISGATGYGPPCHSDKRVIILTSDFGVDQENLNTSKVFEK